MVDAGDEFDREIRLRRLQQRRIAIGIELIIIAACDERHRFLGALERVKVAIAAEIHRQPKRIDAGQVLFAGRNREDDGIETVEPVNADPVCGELLIFDTNQQYATHRAW